MRIKRICYPVTTLGPGNRVGIWVSGCSLSCKGCMSPELQDPLAGKEISCEQILRSISNVKGAVDGFTISGGEPFDQAQQLHTLVSSLRELGQDDIIIYSGYTLAQLRQRGCEYTTKILDGISVLIDGRYIDEFNDGVGLRGSLNQQIHIFRNREKYEYMFACKREVQVFNYGLAASVLVGLL